MSNHDRLGERGHAPVPASRERSDAAPGRTRTMDLPGRMAAARHGVSGAPGRLPFSDVIQRSFGRHHVGAVEAHGDDAAADANQAMGSEAFAIGEHVAFAGAPSLHTAAHEAAHVVQQRGGVRLKGGAGEAGDDHERHADAVAERVVRGESAEALLDQYGDGGGRTARGDAIQHLIVIGHQVIGEVTFDGELEAAKGRGELDGIDEQPIDRLRAEAGDRELHSYDSWLEAAHGIQQPDRRKQGSGTVTVGSMIATNVSPAYRSPMERLLQIIAASSSIREYVGDRPCFITLVDDTTTPAAVTDLGTQINVMLSYWYFETHSLGYLVGMLAHEFAIHPMADAEPSFAMGEAVFKGLELDLGIEGVTKTVSTDRCHEHDHILGTHAGMPRTKLYRRVVLELATALADAAESRFAPVPPKEITNLIDCFLMDCASILATDDQRSQGVRVPSQVAAIYNGYRSQLLAQAKVDDTRVGHRFPATKSSAGVVWDYMKIGGRFGTGEYLGGGSVDHTRYQPNAAQLAVLSTSGLRLHWIEPDGRCVFGALAHVAGLSVGKAMARVLDALQDERGALAGRIRELGSEPATVARCIREGDWAAPHVGDIMLEVGALALNCGVSVVMPDGSTLAVNGGGAMIIRVTSPLEHYHGTR